MGLKVTTKTSKIIDNYIEHNISMYAGAYIYINYEQGCESDVQLLFSIIDSNLEPTKAYPIVTIDHGTHQVKPVSVKMTQSQIFLLPIPVPESADKLIITPLVGQSAIDGDYGKLNININIDTVHH